MAVLSSVEAPTGGHLRSMASFALAMLHAAQDIHYPDGRQLELRVGIHAGPVVAGVIGQKKFSYDLWGDTVNVASRMESTGVPGHIQVSGEIFSRLHEEFEFEPRWEVLVKGKDPMVTCFLQAPRLLG